jgi:signal transduction histidine kinase
VPPLYGLLPAQVRQTACVADGAECCEYDVSWQRRARTGLLWGLAVGAGAALASLAAVMLGAGGILSPGGAGLVAVLGFAGSVAIGRGVDLARQLEAVAGARLGHLALLDQTDDRLAAKLDALARADAKLEPRSDSSPSSQTPAEVERRETAIALAAQQIHIAAGNLERSFEEHAESVDPEAPRRGTEVVGLQRAQVREIREWAAQLAQEGGREGGPRRALDLSELVARAVVALRPSLPREAEIDVSCESGLPPVECEPFQIEQVVIQLLRNAVEATDGLAGPRRVGVSLGRVARGIELAVEDRGPGIEPAALDEVFDPFFDGQPIGVTSGFGLPICYRIVERHGGELRIETEGRAGTRVSVLFPVTAHD